MINYQITLRNFLIWSLLGLKGLRYLERNFKWTAVWLNTSHPPTPPHSAYWRLNSQRKQTNCNTIWRGEDESEGISNKIGMLLYSRILQTRYKSVHHFAADYSCTTNVVLEHALLLVFHHKNLQWMSGKHEESLTFGYRSLTVYVLRSEVEEWPKKSSLHL